MLSDDRLTMSDLIKEQAESERDLAFFQKRSEKLEAELLTLRAEVERLRGLATKLADQAWLQRMRNGNSNMSDFAAKMCASEVDKLIAAIVGLTPPTKE